MGKRDFVRLFWTDAFFCTPRVLRVFRSHGVQGFEVWPPILHRTDQPSDAVVQLRFPVAAPGYAEVDKRQPETCAECGRTKYGHHRRGPMHFRREIARPDTDFLRTHEWFGSGGHSAYREILISNRAASLIRKQGWRGVSLQPVELY